MSTIQNLCSRLFLLLGHPMFSPIFTPARLRYLALYTILRYMPTSTSRPSVVGTYQRHRRSNQRTRLLLQTNREKDFFLSDFESKKIELMTEIIEAKYDKVSEFRETLRKAKKPTIVVESTYDNFWASSIDKKGTAHTDASAWPGKNMLGDIIGKVAVSHCKENRNPPLSNSAPRPSKSAAQLDISLLLSDFKNIRKRDSSGSRKASPKTRTNDG